MLLNLSILFEKVFNVCLEDLEAFFWDVFLWDQDQVVVFVMFLVVCSEYFVDLAAKAIAVYGAFFNFLTDDNTKSKKLLLIFAQAHDEELGPSFASF